MFTPKPQPAVDETPAEFDKDAVVASMMICEMASWYATKGMTLSEALTNLYTRYGYYREGMLDAYMEGLDGVQKRANVMKQLRENTPSEIGGIKVILAEDFLTGVALDMESKQEVKAKLNGLDVLFYTLANGDKFIVRPSGTEPKIKVYFLCHGDNECELDIKIQAYRKAAEFFCK